MPHYRRAGEVPPKRHLRVDHPSGTGYLHEELMGVRGFSADSALLYHLHSPSAIVAVEPVPDPAAPTFAADHPLVPRHLRTSKLAGGADLVTGRRRLLGNADVTLSWVLAEGPSDLYRDAVGDELLYLHSGTAVLETVFGAVEVAAGDYVVVPAGTTHRWVPSEPVGALVLETTGHVSFPDRYLSPTGQFLEGSPFSERDLRPPAAPVTEEGTEVPVLVRTGAGLTRHVHARHPFDVVAWDGCLYPFALSIHAFEPIVGAIHQPPPVHQTFAGPNLVVCSFVPRPFDFHPRALKVPYHHANVDSDEVILYCAGDFMSRAGAGIGEGSLTWHPPGFVHGPQPGSVERAVHAERTEELAVMVDTFHRLELSDEARHVADEDYPWSWAGP
ncbi:MAG: homogentisate 1,2-dioxygenase [Acidobacteriota bacterium]|nr:homogentisate 1,2-dioxygenase [Acidobacteriota bacterium]